MRRIVVAPWAGERSLFGDAGGDFFQVLCAAEIRIRIRVAGLSGRLVLGHKLIRLELQPLQPGELVGPQIAPPAPADLDEREHFEDQEHPEISPEAAGRAPERSSESGRPVP